MKNKTALAVFCLLLLPAGLSHAVPPDPMEKYFCEDTQRSFFTEKEPGEFTPRRFPNNARAFKLPKPGGLSRVFLAGESVAAIMGSQEAALSAGVEVLNCGMGGYESSRILPVVREVLNYTPDLVVVFSGNNEDLPEQCPGFGYDLQRRGRKLLERYYSIGKTPAAGKSIAARKVYEGRLRKMAKAAKKKKVPLVFCRLPANMKDLPPEGRLPYWNKIFFEGARLLWKGDARQALEKFKLALADKPADSFINFYSGRALLALGRAEEAGSYLEAALPALNSGREMNEIVSKVAREEGACVAELDKVFFGLASGPPGFLEFMDQVHWVPSLNKVVLREILRAGEACGYKGPYAPLPRDEEDLRKAAAGDETRLSYAVSWIAAAREGFNEPALAELEFLRRGDSRVLRSASASAAGLNRELTSNFWFKPGEDSGSRLYPALLAHLAEAEVRSGRPEAALKLARKGLSLAPEMRSLRFSEARALAEKGEAGPARAAFCSLAEAGGEWSVAASLAGHYGYKPCGLSAYCAPASSKEFSDSAVGELAAGRVKHAEELLRNAIFADPSNAEARLTLCSVLGRTGRGEEGAEECLKAAQAALAFDDGRTPALRALAVNAYLGRAGLLDKAGKKKEAEESRRLAEAARQP
jgi:predicted Zn-dependent protease